MRWSFSLAYVIPFILISCGSQPGAQAPKAKLAPIASKLSPEGTTKLMAVVVNYYSVKDALVATKEANALDASRRLLASAGNMMIFLNADSVNKGLLQPYLDTIVTQCNEALTIKDPSCERQRLLFGTLSSAMYGMLRKVDLKNAGVYKEYCPMAFNDKGAIWLSSEEEIKNPYFGKKMLECGEVQDSL